MRLIERLFQYIEHKKLTFYAFERGCGMGNGYLKKQFKGKGTVGSDILEKIHHKYADLSLIWLITGKGKMLIEPGVAIEQAQLLHDGDPGYGLPGTDLIAVLRAQIATLERSLADKDKIIRMLESKLQKLKAKQ